MKETKKKKKKKIKKTKPKLTHSISTWRDHLFALHFAMRVHALARAHSHTNGVRFFFCRCNEQWAVITTFHLWLFRTFFRLILQIHSLYLWAIASSSLIEPHRASSYTSTVAVIVTAAAESVLCTQALKLAGCLVWSGAVKVIFFRFDHWLLLLFSCSFIFVWRTQLDALVNAGSLCVFVCVCVTVSLFRIALNAHTLYLTLTVHTHTRTCCLTVCLCVYIRRRWNKTPASRFVILYQ